MNVASPARISISDTAIRTMTAAICLAVLVATAGPSLGETPNSDPVLAVVNGKEIHQSDYIVVSAMIGRNVPQTDESERRPHILSMMIDTMLLAQVAAEQKMTDDPDTQRRVTFARNEGLSNHLLLMTGQQAVTDEAMHQLYDKMIAETKPEQEVRLRNMIFTVKNGKDPESVKVAQARAEAALKRIKGGESYATVWADVSDNRTVVGNGGELGWVIREELGKELADAAFSLKPGEVSPVVKTMAGFHILQVDEKRDRTPATFEQIKDRLASAVASRAEFEVLQKARDAAKVEVLEQPKPAVDKVPAEKGPGDNAAQRSN